MNKIISIVLLASIAVLIGCKTKTEKGTSFEVEGVFTNSNAKVVYLEEVPINVMIPIVIDSAQIGTDGSFSLKAFSTQATVYNLRLDQSQTPIVSLINDAPKITVNATLIGNGVQATEDYEVKGSPASEELKQFLIRFNSDLQKIFMLQSKAAEQNISEETIYAEQDSIVNSLYSYVSTAINQSKNPAQSLIMLANYQNSTRNPQLGLRGFDLDELSGILNKIAAEHPTHTSVNELKKNIDIAKQQMLAAQPKWVGKSAPDITMPDVNGKNFSLRSLKGKYVLIDFWASWCTPCRQENPNIVAAYQKFKNKNFEILGVSLDEDKSKWLEAIKKDRLNWPNISDLLGWRSAAVGLYEFDGIPFNVLIDPQGKVIAEGLRGAALSKKLSEVL